MDIDKVRKIQTNIEKNLKIETSGLFNLLEVKSDGYHTMLLDLSYLKTFLNELRMKFLMKIVENL